MGFRKHHDHYVRLGLIQDQNRPIEWAMTYPSLRDIVASEPTCRSKTYMRCGHGRILFEKSIAHIMRWVQMLVYSAQWK